jgi:periplasmic divalent cation tolerance protein
MAEALEVHVTCPDLEAAESLAQALVNEELAACVTIIPGVRSVYRFQGTLHDEQELLCLIKTHPAVFERLQERIVALHPYDVPEILAFAAHDGSRAYLAWLHASIGLTERS